MNKCVYVVDDQLDARESVKNILDAAGFRIAGESVNARDAIHELNYMEFLPDIILIDTDLPVMDGYSAAEIIGAIYPEITIILTGSGEIDEEIAGRCGVAGTVSKNIPPNEFLYNFTRIAGAIIFETGVATQRSHIYS